MNKFLLTGSLLIVFSIGGLTVETIDFASAPKTAKDGTLAAVAFAQCNTVRSLITISKDGTVALIAPNEVRATMGQLAKELPKEHAAVAVIPCSPPEADGQPEQPTAQKSPGSLSIVRSY